MGPESVWYLLVVLGCCSGLCAGLLGIGGGTILVPGFVLLLPYLGLSGPEATKIAIATSLALIVPTGIASAQTHALKSAIDWRMFALLCPSIIAGAFVAAMLASMLSVQFLAGLYLVVSLQSAWGLVRSANHSPSHSAAASKPGLLTIATKCVTGGAVSSLLGQGVAAFSVPILARFIPVQRAIGTAAVLGVPMALAGTAGYMLSAAPNDCREGCVGYIFLPAVAATGIGAVLAAPVGAWLTHIFPTTALKYLFAGYLVLTCGLLAYEYFSLDSMRREGLRLVASIASIAGNAETRGPVAAEPPVCLGEGSGRNDELAAAYGPRRAFVPFIQNCVPESTVAGVVSRIHHRSQSEIALWGQLSIRGTGSSAPTERYEAPNSSASPALPGEPERRTKQQRKSKVPAGDPPSGKARSRASADTGPTPSVSPRSDRASAATAPSRTCEDGRGCGLRVPPPPPEATRKQGAASRSLSTPGGGGRTSDWGTNE